MQVFSLKNIFYSYQPHQYNLIDNGEKIFTLKNISLEINKQDFVGIVGKTGSGKSTLIQIIAGLINYTSGEMYFNGKNFTDKNFNKEDFRKKIGFTFQFPEIQLFETTIEKEIAFALKNFNFPKNKIPLIIDEVLLQFDFIPEKVKTLSPLALSEGQKRKIALASVLAYKPEVLILDEPFSNLDAKGILELIALLKKLNANGTTIILVSHDMDIVAEITNRILALKEGEIIYNGNTLDFFSNQELFKNGDFPTCDTFYLAKKIKESNLIECELSCKYADLLAQIAQGLKR